MTASTDRARKGDLVAIHVAKKALGWDEDTYRDVMFSVCEVRSAAELDPAKRRRFLAHLQACRKQGTAPARTPWKPELRKLWSLWQQLADADLVKDRKRPALEAWAARQCGVDRLEWLTTAQLDLVLASAKQWLKRGAE